MLEEILNLLNDENTFDLGVKLLESKFDCEVGFRYDVKLKIPDYKYGSDMLRIIGFVAHHSNSKRMYMYIEFPTVEKAVSFQNTIKSFDKKLFEIFF
jgi:hypothetical protein